MRRNHDAEMMELIEKATEGGDFIAPMVAETLYEDLIQTDPDLITGWLKDHAVRILTQAIRDFDRRNRSKARHQAGALTFHEASENAAESGDVTVMSVFQTRFVIDDRNTRRTVAEMTGTDHRFVAGRYTRESRRHLLLASFHEAVARKVGDRKTSDILTEDQYRTMLQSVIGE